MKNSLQISNSDIAPFLRLFREVSGSSKQVILLLFFVLTGYSLQAQDCGCDHLIKPGQNTYLDGRQMGIKPGDVVCIKAGSYKEMHLSNFNGTTNQPVIIKNCGGKVKVGNANMGYAFVMQSSKHFRVTGTGSSDTYGIQVSGTRQGGSTFSVGRCSSFEIDHVETFNSGYAGMFVKQDPYCGKPETYGQNFVMENVKLHHNYVHDVQGEGFYVGYTGGKQSCGAYPHDIKHLRIYDNIVENTGRDGIQVSRASLDCEIYGNRVTNFGKQNDNYHQAGILIGGGTTGKLYNNWIEKGSGQGIQVFGTGGNVVYNNVVLNAAKDGIFCDDRTTVSGRGFAFINNTVINAGGDGILMQSRQSKGNLFYNNLIVDPGKKHLNIYSNVDHKAANNYYAKSVGEAKFKDASGKDFHLQTSSPAVDKGRDVSSLGITEDFEGNTRAQNSNYDIGAYELGGGPSPSPGPSPNQAPTVTTSSDQTLVLPQNSTKLSSIAKDTDGVIEKYVWRLESGSAVVLQDSTAQEVTVTDLNFGSYVFSITVTDDRGDTASDEIKIEVVEAPVLIPDSLVQGLHYRYFEGTWNMLPEFSQLPVLKQGNSDDFLLSTRLRNDDFGFVYEGYIRIETSGMHTFYTTSDDGSQLFINNSLVVNNDGLHGSREESGQIYLGAGMHPITVTFFERTQGNILKVSYESPGETKKSIPTTVLYTARVTEENISPAIDGESFIRLSEGVASVFTFLATDEDSDVTLDWHYRDFPAFVNVDYSGNTLTIRCNPSSGDAGQYQGMLCVVDDKGAADTVLVSLDIKSSSGNISYSYYEGTWQKLPDFTELVPISSGKESTISLNLRQRDDNFAFLFSGHLNIPSTGEYTFETFSDDGSQMFINDQLVVENDGLHAARYKSGTVYLEEGVYPIVVTYFEKSGNETLKVYWKNTAHGVVERQEIPSSAFVAAPDTTDLVIPPAIPPAVEPSTVVNVNFNLCCHSADTPWNNTHGKITNPGDQYKNLTGSDGKPTEIGIQYLGYSGEADYNEVGSVTGDDSGAVPDVVSQTAFWTSSQATFSVTGLEPTHRYRLTFYGSRDGNGDRSTAYSVGDATVVLEAGYNTDNVVSIEDIEPDSDNAITFTVAKAANSNYGYLNALVIEAILVVSPTIRPNEDQLLVNRVYPNPFTDHINLEIKSVERGEITLQIFDTQGFPVSQQTVSEILEGTTLIRIDTEDYIKKSGMYILKAISQERLETVQIIRK